MRAERCGDIGEEHLHDAFDRVEARGPATEFARGVDGDRLARAIDQFWDVPQRLIEAMSAYPFPGNVRELENLIKRIVVLESEEQVVAELTRPRASRVSTS